MFKSVPNFLKKGFLMANEKTSFTKRIGKTTFTICVKKSETAKKTLDTIYKDICKNEVLSDFSDTNTAVNVS